MATIYDLEELYMRIYDMDLDEDTFNDTLESLDFFENTTEKLEAYGKVIENLTADAEMYGLEKKRLADKEAQAKKKIERLKDTVKRFMLVTDTKRIDAGLFKYSIRNNKRVEVDETRLPREWFNEKVTLTPNKKELAKHLKAGEEIKGATLVESQSLNFK